MPTLTWQMVQAEALNRIRTRQWPPGTRIPDEADLAQELGCARATVNRALRELASAGVLDRRRKGGTRVPLTPVRKATFEIPIIRQDIETRGQRPGYRLLSRALIPNEPGPARLHLSALHLADDTPFCHERRWIDPTNAPGVLDADFTTSSANEWLVSHIAFVSGTISFGATAASAETAAQLTCPAGTALLQITRETTGPTGPITRVTLTYAPGYQMQTLL